MEGRVSSQRDRQDQQGARCGPALGHLKLQVCLHTGAGLSPFGLHVNEDTDLLWLRALTFYTARLFEIASFGLSSRRRMSCPLSDPPSQVCKGSALACASLGLAEP